VAAAIVAAQKGLGDLPPSPRLLRAAIASGVACGGDGSIRRRRLRLGGEILAVFQVGRRLTFGK
jgi:hypothetical protein